MLKIGHYGFRTPRSEVAAESERAAKLAEKIGFPVALRIPSPDIVDKTDVGGWS